MFLFLKKIAKLLYAILNDSKGKSRANDDELLYLKVLSLNIHRQVKRISLGFDRCLPFLPCTRNGRDFSDTSKWSNE
ncbi:hypothetical protein T01_13360 [Trichinella spiralis]|uniref:Uncharacterized protein n=1 Tax=Trichinella spiralis TaxID=6334 RepID=A0A0V1BDM7_TRISP|nr:hypothetical protein T01_13360 [Trichinella spiralis]